MAVVSLADQLMVTAPLGCAVKVSGATYLDVFLGRITETRCRTSEGSRRMPGVV
jgi:hypothetical protein